MTSNTSSRSKKIKYEIRIGPANVMIISAIMRLGFTLSLFRNINAAIERKSDAIGDFSRVMVFTIKPKIKNNIKSILNFCLRCIEVRNNEPTIPKGINNERSQKNI